ncbi:MAG TPA: methyltransferase domain-containing protein [Acidobacteriota bacterium]|jgi:2-polyprenyl-3-methyl-5-hydroxy-6-metoxy-1,4-benzoquinol methylase
MGSNGTCFIHPADLRRRRQRCRPIVERLQGRLKTGPISSCNICGCAARAILADQDRYGLALRTAICLRCGLIYLMDRLSERDYQDFYLSGSYRALISSFKGRSQTLALLRGSQARYAERLAKAWQGLITLDRGSRLLDIGGSTGLVAQRFAAGSDCAVTLLDPAAQEVESVPSAGFERVVGPFEAWQSPHRFDLILLCRTVEHLFDLRAALLKIRSLLRPNGLFFCDIADFLETCRREGPPAVTTKVDHCFWLCQETAPSVFAHLGFEILAVDVALPPDQVGFLLRAAEGGKLAPVPPEWIQRQLRGFRELASAWQQVGHTPLDARDWVRVQGSRLKARALRALR